MKGESAPPGGPSHLHAMMKDKCATAGQQPPRLASSGKPSAPWALGPGTLAGARSGRGEFTQILRATGGAPMVTASEAGERGVSSRGSAQLTPPPCLPQSSAASGWPISQ